MSKFSSLSIQSWQQFEEVKIEFHPRLTILTGANGSGKSTLLRILGQHRGWPTFQVSTPAKLDSTGKIEFLPRLFKGVDRSDDSLVGKITYDNGHEASLTIPGRGIATYQITIPGAQGTSCLFIPSHRQTFTYSAIGNIPTNKKSEQDAYNEIYSISLQRHHGNASQSPSTAMKSALIGWAIQGHGVTAGTKTVMAPDDAQRATYYGFQEVLRKLLPESLGFEEFEIRNMEIVFVCNNGADEFLLETASGGVAAIIDLAWQVFMYSKGFPGPFTVIIDEAENHLHPALQRTLLPNLLEAFPEASYIVSSHSPLVIGSVRDANVYVLRYNDQKKVISEKLDLEGKTRSASEILDDVLGVSTSLPVWVESEIEKILDSIKRSTTTETVFKELRIRLRDSGLEHLLPEVMTKVIEEEK